MIFAKGELFKEEYRAPVERLTAAMPSFAAPESPAAGERWPRSGLPSMRPFYDLLAKGLAGCATNGRPLVGSLCNFVPDEFLLAAECIPVRLCSEDLVCASMGDKIIPADICPLLKSVGGAFFGAFPAHLDLVIVPATCDGKTRLAELLNLKCPVYILDLPRNLSFPESTERVAQSFAELWQFLKKRYGGGRPRQKLQAACAQTNRRTALFRRIFEFRAAAPGPINAGDYFAMTSASFLMPANDWTAAASAVLSDAERRPPAVAGPALRKLLLAGSPIIFPNGKLLEITAEAGGYIAADLLCSAYGRLYDPVIIEEDTEAGLIQAITAKTIAPSLCPCYPGVNKIADRMVDLVSHYSLAGILYHQLRLCQVVDIQAGILRQILKERGIPALFIKTDLSGEDRGQLKTRVEAFLEMTS
jgi:benzoyl-CoA reductase/2-hydroxyglutaryl-CoA dehydratase subunit BcrC/BadD/HgdB